MEAIEGVQVEDEGGFTLWFSREDREERIDSEVTRMEVTLGLDWKQIITICNYIFDFCACDIFKPTRNAFCPP